MKILITSLIALTTIVFFTSFSDKSIEISIDMVIPNDIDKADIKTVKFIKSNSTSSIYEIQTINGETFYQVVSIVLTNALPAAAEYACNALIKSPYLCKRVEKITAALINLYSDKISSKLEKWWSAKIDGNSGIGSIKTSNIEEAEDGQLAFEISRERIGIPWSTPTIRPFNKWSRE